MRGSCQIVSHCCYWSQVIGVRVERPLYETGVPPFSDGAKPRPATSARAARDGEQMLLDTQLGAEHTSGLYARLCVAESYPLPCGTAWLISPTSLQCRLTLRLVELRMFRQILSFFTKSQMEAGMAADFFIGESLVGDGNEIAHIDLIIGSKSGPAGAAFTQALSRQYRRLHYAARRRHAKPPRQARHAPLQQGHDQGCQAGGPDVRPGSGRRRPRRHGFRE